MTGDHTSHPATSDGDRAAAADAATSAAVMIVDDNPANIELLKRMLATIGVTQVDTFTNPHLALAHCGQALPDLVLLDLHMPELDGFAVMSELARIVPPGRFVPVLVLTADIAPSAKERALAAGAKDFLTKPFDRTEVLLRVTNLLETRALYGQLEAHNEALRADLDARTAAERQTAQERQQLSRRIDQAFAPNGLSTVFQPIADLTNGTIVGAEALTRFTPHPYRPPNTWFTDADQIGRSTELELVAATAALDLLHKLPNDTFLAINASPAAAISPDFAALLAQHPSDRLVLELTEHTPIDDYDTLLTALDRLRCHGTRIAVDDTGAGYAGFQHLIRLRPDIIKLDTTLTRGIDTDPVRRSLAAALVAFAAETAVTIVAEGIETPTELATLQRIGIPWGQGYHLARPRHLPFAAPRLANLDAPQ